MGASSDFHIDACHPSSSLSMSKFVVSGSRGYLARRLISRLVADGHEVVGLTRVGDGGEKGFLQVEVGDYTDELLLASTISGAQAVFHLAALAHQRSVSTEDLSLFHAANVIPTQSLARACRVAGAGRFVMLSSIGVLGNRTELEAFSDNSLPAPVELYSVSKLCAERQVIEELSDGECDYCILRPPLIYGPGSPGNFANLINVTANAKMVPLAGIRSPKTFIYLNHLLDALIVAATHHAVSRQTFVISDGTDTSVSEVVLIAARIFGRESWRIFEAPEKLLRTFSILTGQRAKFDKLYAPLRVDCSGFKKATGWVPVKTASEAIAETLINWPRL